MTGASTATTPELAVVIPTRDRRAVLLETVNRLIAFAGSQPIEVIVIDDGSSDGTAAALPAMATTAPWPFRFASQTGAGPAAARNRGLELATAPVCAFIGDDSLPSPQLVERHLAFHRARPQDNEALLGLVVPAPPLDASPFQRWLHEHGAQFGYAALRAGEAVDPASFWTSNISVKTALLRAADGFDESFPGAACEDAELGLRLARRGMRLHYDPQALALHFHPTNLARVLERMRRIGVAHRRLCELAPEMPRPRRPGARHRIKAAALTAAFAGLRTQGVRAATWRFLCDEALRESYWAASDDPAEGLRIGAALARRAIRDPLANPPMPSLPAAAIA